MGMDVIGRAPTSERGKYFENNSSWWHPLATYCKEIAPEIARGCRHWHTNSGDGLDAAASRALAEALEAEIESGGCLDIERELRGLPARLRRVRDPVKSRAGARDDAGNGAGSRANSGISGDCCRVLPQM